MGVDRRRQRRHMPRESLREEQVVRRPVYRRNGRVTDGMKAVQPVEPGLLLPLPPRELDAALGDPDAGLGSEERISRSRPLTTSTLVRPEPPEFRYQGVR